MYVMVDSDLRQNILFDAVLHGHLARGHPTLQLKSESTMTYILVSQSVSQLHISNPNFKTPTARTGTGAKSECTK